MKTLLAVLVACAVLGTPARAQDVVAYDGIATVYALKVETASTKQPVLQLKHGASPFASKAECDAKLAEALPGLAAAIHEKYGITEGVDFSIEAKCEPSGQPV